MMSNAFFNSSNSIEQAKAQQQSSNLQQANATTGLLNATQSSQFGGQFFSSNSNGTK